MGLVELLHELVKKYKNSRAFPFFFCGSLCDSAGTDFTMERICNKKWGREFYRVYDFTIKIQTEMLGFSKEENSLKK